MHDSPTSGKKQSHVVLAQKIKKKGNLKVQEKIKHKDSNLLIFCIIMSKSILRLTKLKKNHDKKFFADNPLGEAD